MAEAADGMVHGCRGMTAPRADGTGASRGAAAGRGRGRALAALVPMCAVLVANGGGVAGAQVGAGRYMVRIHLVTAGANEAPAVQPLPADADAEVFVISKDRWQTARASFGGVPVTTLAQTFVVEDVAGMAVVVEDAALFELAPGASTLEFPTDRLGLACPKGECTLVLRADVAGRTITAWWSLKLPADWASTHGGLPYVHEVYVYPGLDLWTQGDDRYDVEGDAWLDKQAFSLRPPAVDAAGNVRVDAGGEPVLLVHGKWGTDGYWNQVPARVAALGLDVWEFTYPEDQSLRLSAGLLSHALQRVLQHYAPGARAVLVGHSQGGLVTRAYLQSQGVLAAGEADVVPPTQLVQYRGDVRRWMSLGSPHHGMLMANRIVESQVRDLVCDKFLPFFKGVYSREPAFGQLAVGSRFIWDLAGAAFPAQFDRSVDLLSVAGTAPPDRWLGPQTCGTDWLNDMVVDVVSASLLESGVPLLLMPKDHQQLCGAVTPRIGSDDPYFWLPSLIARFARGQEYAAGFGGVLVTPGGDPYQAIQDDPIQDIYSRAKSPHATAGLAVRYLDQGDAAVRVAGMLVSSPAWYQKSLALTWYDGTVLGSGDRPLDPPTAYVVTDDGSRRDLGANLEAQSRLEVNLVAAVDGADPPLVIRKVDLRSGHFQHVTLCGDETVLAFEAQAQGRPVAIDRVGPDSVAVKWRTNRPASAAVTWYPAGTDDRRQWVDWQPRTDHTVVVGGIQPGWRMVFEIRSASACGGDAVEEVVYDHPGGGAPTAETTATVLLFDVSGSMSSLWRGGVKIESAQQAGRYFVDIIERQSGGGPVRDRVAVAMFDDRAAVAQELTDELGLARTAIEGLAPGGYTDVGAGLEVALSQLAGALAATERGVVVLLSDGQSNTGMGPAEILAGPVAAAAALGICVYTVGYGDPGDLDERLLQDIASGSGCGRYFYADNAFELGNVYIRSRGESTGLVLAEASGVIAQGETTAPLLFEVPAGQGELSVTLNWPGSWLELLLDDPSGRRVDASYRGAALHTDRLPVQALVQAPQPGLWQARVYGTDVPQGSTEYYLLSTTRMTGASPPTPPRIVPSGGAATWSPRRTSGAAVATLALLLTGATMAAVFAVATRGSAGSKTVVPPTRPVGVLHVRAGDATGMSYQVEVRRLPFTIGRAPTCDLVLQDGAVGRQHARLVRREGQTVLEDLVSTNGTWVNGRRVVTAVLRGSEQVRLGGVHLRFEPRGADRGSRIVGRAEY